MLASEQSKPKPFISPFESVVASLSSSVQQQPSIATAAQTLVNAPEPIPVVTKQTLAVAEPIQKTLESLAMNDALESR